MHLRVSLFAPVVLGLFALATLPGQFRSGVWQGNANFDQEGGFSDCVMTAQEPSGILLGFVISKDFNWGIVIADETRQFDVGTSKAVLLLVDGHEPIAAVAKVVDAHGILIPLDYAEPVIETMRAETTLRISMDTTEFSFPLTGTREAISALAQCVSEHQGTSRVEL